MEKAFVESHRFRRTIPWRQRRPVLRSIVVGNLSIHFAFEAALSASCLKSALLCGVFMVITAGGFGAIAVRIRFVDTRSRLPHGKGREMARSGDFGVGSLTNRLRRRRRRRR